jgi:hypothetical protein
MSRSSVIPHPGARAVWRCRFWLIVASIGLLNMFLAALVAALHLRMRPQRDTIRRGRTWFDRSEQRIDMLTASIDVVRQRQFEQEVFSGDRSHN